MSVLLQTSRPRYVPGHSGDEIRRREKPGDYLGGQTRELLVHAGLAAGMRVLEFGSGAGDAAFVAADLVGACGEVVAIDRAEGALARARARAEERRARNVRFVPGDETCLASIAAGRRFDAVIGRLVLLHQRDPAAVLRALMAQVLPGGIVAFHELDQDPGCWSEPRLPLLEQVHAMIVETSGRGGIRSSAALVARAFEAAGVEERQLIRYAEVEDGSRPLAHAFLAEVVRTLLPLAEQTGVATSAQMEVETLGERLAAEARAAGAYWIPVHSVLAWGRVPEAQTSPAALTRRARA